MIGQSNQKATTAVLCCAVPFMVLPLSFAYHFFRLPLTTTDTYSCCCSFPNDDLAQLTAREECAGIATVKITHHVGQASLFKILLCSKTRTQTHRDFICPCRVCLAPGQSTAARGSMNQNSKRDTCPVHLTELVPEVPYPAWRNHCDIVASHWLVLLLTLKGFDYY